MLGGSGPDQSRIWNYRESIKAKSCVEGGDPTLLAVRQGDEFKLYQLAVIGGMNITIDERWSSTILFESIHW